MAKSWTIIDRIAFKIRTCQNAIELPMFPHSPYTFSMITYDYTIPKIRSNNSSVDFASGFSVTPNPKTLLYWDPPKNRFCHWAEQTWTNQHVPPRAFPPGCPISGPLSRLVILHHLAASILSRNRWCCRVEHCGTTLKQSSRTMINYHWWLMTCRTILVFFAQLCAAIVFCYLDLFGIIDSSANHSIKHAWTSACLSCLTV